MRVRLLIAASLLTAALAAGASARPSAAPSPAALLDRYVPVLVLHPAEQLAPAPVDGFLADADLEHRAASGWEPAPGPVPTGGADLRLDQRACAAIDGPAATPCYAASEAAHGGRPVVYGAALRRGSRTELQYWVWYAWDVYSPTVPPGELWQVHEGDWEAVSVVVDTSGRPLLVGYSEHGKGVRRDWTKAPKQGTHPLAYVALGSHAQLPVAGNASLRPARRRLALHLGDPPERAGPGRPHGSGQGRAAAACARLGDEPGVDGVRGRMGGGRVSPSARRPAPVLLRDRPEGPRVPRAVAAARGGCPELAARLSPTGVGRHGW